MDLAFEDRDSKEIPFVCSTMDSTVAGSVTAPFSHEQSRGSPRQLFLRRAKTIGVPDRNTSVPSDTPSSDALASSAPESAQTPVVTEALPEELVLAIRGAQDKKAEDIRVFDLRGVTSLTEHFLICSGTNQRQNQAISDEILRSMKEAYHRLPLGVEGYDKADWILMDYGDFIVHILAEQARKYYDLERLWRQAKECEVPSDLPGHGHAA